jgi:metallo-beta-lactamase class B
MADGRTFDQELEVHQRLKKESSMKNRSIAALLLTAGLSAIYVAGQSRDTADAHVAVAKRAAGDEHTGLFNSVCTPPTDPRPATQGAPTRAEWHAEPAKVFDNLYFVGQTEYSAWAVTTSDGIIIVDALWDYSVEDEVVGGLRKLGLDPAKIKYVLLSHGHIDHAGGARYLQDHFGAHVIASAADWDLMDRDKGSWPKPKRDMVATDGQKLTLGDTTLTLYLTPGHTLGTISTLIPVKDGGKPHVAAEWGGTAFNWLRSPALYNTPERPSSFWFETYSSSAERFRDIAAAAGADVLISNHTIYDGSQAKLAALAKRKPGDPNPYVVGKDSVRRYLTVADECAKAGLLRIQ